MQNWILIKKGDEEKLVHPGNVTNHIRFGWERVVAEEPTTEVVPAAAPVETEVIAESKPVETAKQRKDREKAEAKIIAEINAVTTTSELYKFQTQDRSQAIEDAINKKGQELFEAEEAARLKSEVDTAAAATEAGAEPAAAADAGSETTEEKPKG